jgi:hypothetical protein
MAPHWAGSGMTSQDHASGAKQRLLGRGLSDLIELTTFAKFTTKGFRRNSRKTISYGIICHSTY